MQQDVFHRFSHKTAEIVGKPWAFALAVAIVVGWAFTGPLFGYSDTWQLVINTGTTIVTFLIVFLIQNTQNREAMVMQLKLDELIRALRYARNRLVDLEALDEEELKELQKEFKELHDTAERHLHERMQQRGAPHDRTGKRNDELKKTSRS
jgi:low affinity Fe/Cu permease